MTTATPTTTWRGSPLAHTGKGANPSRRIVTWWRILMPSNVKYTDRVRLHPNLARLPPMPYRHRDSMSRKLRAMREARERRRLEGVEPRYPRELPALRRTLIIIDYDFGRVEHRIDLYRRRGLIVTGRSPTVWSGSAESAGRRCSPVFASSSPAYALPDFRCRVFLTSRGRRKIATKAPSDAPSP